MFDAPRNSLIDRQTLFNLSRSVNDGNFVLQLALTKLYGILTFHEEPPDEVITEVGASIAQLRLAVSKLEIYLLTTEQE